MSAAGPARPAIAVAGLAIGLGLSALPWRGRPPAREQGASGRSGPTSSPVGAVAVVALAAVAVAVAASLSHGTVWSARLGLSSPDRTSELTAALRLWRSQLLTGVGPNRFLLVFTRADGVTVVDHFAHNEYVQFGAEHGIIGLVGVLALVVGLAVSLRGGWSHLRGLEAPDRAVLLALVAASTAALVDFLVHSGFDFLWHVPVVPAVVFTGVGISAAVPDPTGSEAACAEPTGADVSATPDRTSRSTKERRER